MKRQLRSPATQAVARRSSADAHAPASVAIDAMNVLEIEDLRILLRSGEREVALVDGVSLTVAPGAVVGLAGESGSGKTLTGLSALGFLPDRSRATGAVRFAGQDVLKMSQSRLRRMRGHQVAVVFQDPMTSLHPMLSVGRQLTEHVEVHLGLSAAQARERAIELLETVRLPDPEHVLSSYPAPVLRGDAPAHRHRQRAGLRTASC